MCCVSALVHKVLSYFKFKAKGDKYVWQKKIWFSINTLE